ncbi:MAG: MMPL family transporter [Pirellulaceae bacterium]|nr:MMPL family transporter [Pirellulaceae bacterium]
MVVGRWDELFQRLRWPLCVLLVLLTMAAIIGVLRLEFDDVPRSVFRTDDIEFDRLEEVFRNFGSDDNDCILVVQPASARNHSGASSDDLFSPAAVTALRSLVGELKQLDGIDSVRSLTDVVTFTPQGGVGSLLPPEGTQDTEIYRAAVRQATEHPLVRGQLLSPDATTSLIIVRLADASLGISQIQPLLQDIRNSVERSQVGDVLWVRATGVPVIRTEIYDVVRRESVRFIFIGVVLALLMSLVLFRRLGAVIVVSSAPMLGSLWTLGAMGLVGEKLNIINTIVPTLVMIVGFTDAVHLMHHLRRCVSDGMPPMKAASLTIRHLWLACLMTSLTTAVGFGSLAVARVDIIRRLGLTCSAGAILAFIAVVLAVPLLSSTWLGNYLVPRKPSNPDNWRVRLLDKTVDVVLRYYRLVTIGGVITTGLLLWMTLQLRPDNRLTESIPATQESAQALAHCDRALGGILMAYAVVEWNEDYGLKSPELLAAIGEVQRALDDDPSISYPLSILNLLQALPGSQTELAGRVSLLPWVPKDLLQRLVREDLRQAIVSAHLPDTGTNSHLPALARLSHRFAEIQQRYPGIEVYLTGSVAVAGRNINQMISDLANSLLMASVVIFGCLSLGFRSWLFGLLSILPNVFPLLFTASVLVLFGQPLQLTGVIVFSICLGVAVDDTIHLLSRFRYEVATDRDVPGAVRRSVHAVGTALVTTTLVLLAGFGSVLTSEMPPSRLFAWMSCTAIFAALLGDLLMLPALLAWFADSKSRRS